MALDDSFKKPGAVPFKWETKPGVPKTHQNHHHRKPSPKLTPPPAGLYVLSPVEPRNRSFRSERWRLERPLLARTETVSTGCFLSPLLRRMASRKRPQKAAVEPERGSEYEESDLETVSRWSRKSLSPFRDSATWSSLSPASMSNRSSPRPGIDSEWAGFGLF